MMIRVATPAMAGISALSRELVSNKAWLSSAPGRNLVMVVVMVDGHDMILIMVVIIIIASKAIGWDDDVPRFTFETQQPSLM